MGQNRARTGADVDLDISRWNSSMATLIRDAAKIDSTMRDVVQSFNDAESKIKGFTVDLGVQADTGALKEIQTFADLLDGETIKINTEVSDDGLRQMRGQIEDETMNIRVNVLESELDNLKRRITDETIDIDVDVKDEELDTLIGRISDKFQFTIDINPIGAAGGILNTVTSGLGLDHILDMNTQLQILQGTTGDTIPMARELIEDLYTNAWGESREEIRETVGLAQQLGMSDVPAAVENAFKVKSITGDELNRILLAMDQLVDRGVVSNTEEAGDLIVAAFQNGANAGEDLLDTIVEYTPNFADLELTGAEIANVLIGSIEEGFGDTDRGADALREFAIRMSVDAKDNPEVQAAFEQLNLTEMLIDTQKGETRGAELMSAVVQGIESLPVEDQPAIASILFGTKLEDFSIAAISALDPLQTRVEELDGVATRASDAVNDTLPTALESLKRTFEVEAAEFINNTFDIDAIIDKLKEGVGRLFAELDAGTPLFSALETAFELDGLQNTMDEVVGSFLDFAIGLLDIVGDAQRALGRDASGTEAAEARLGDIRLEQDIFSAESLDDLRHAVDDAFNAGVADADVVSTLASQMQSAIDNSDFQRAFDLAGLMFQSDPEASQQAITDLNSQLDLYFVEIENALAANDFSLVQAMVENVGGEQAVPPALLDQIDALALDIDTRIGEALQKNDFTTALKLADDLGDEEFVAAITEMQAAYEGMGEIVATKSVKAGEDTDAMGEEVETTGDTIDSTTVAVKTNFSGIATAAGDTKKQTKDSFGKMVTDIEDFGTTTEDVGDRVDTKLDAVKDTTIALDETMESFVSTQGEEFSLLGENITLWGDSAVETFQYVDFEFANMVGSIQVNTIILSEILTFASQSLSDFNQSVMGTVDGLGGAGSTVNNTTNSTTNNITVQNNAQMAATADAVRGY